MYIYNMAYITGNLIGNRTLFYNIRPLISTLRLFSTPPKEKIEDEDDFDKPIKYSTSKAATWKAEYSFSGSTNPHGFPLYQPLVITISLSVFMIYFFILREENDIDEKLSGSLYDHVEDMEEVQVRNSIKYYKEFEPNYDTSKLEQRLAEILAQKNQS